jgi:hypothetical protein
MLWTLVGYLTPWRQASAHPSEAMMGIQWLKLTGAAILVFRVSMSL